MVCYICCHSVSYFVLAFNSSFSFSCFNLQLYFEYIWIHTHFALEFLLLLPDQKFFTLKIFNCCCMIVKLCPTIFWPQDYSPSGFSGHEFPRQEHWSGLPCPPPGDLPDPGMISMSPALAGGSLTTEQSGNPKDI